MQAGESVTTDSKITMTATKLTPGDAAIHKTLCSTVTYQNGGNEPASFNGVFDWKLQDPNGAIVMSGLFGSDSALNSGQLAPGGKTTGDVCFEAPRAVPPVPTSSCSTRASGSRPTGSPGSTNSDCRHLVVGPGDAPLTALPHPVRGRHTPF